MKDRSSVTVAEVWSVRRITFAALPLIAFMAVVPLCQGGAFSIAEMGSRAAGMGTAFIGIADDGSALYYNPAGIAFQSGTFFEMDNTVVVGEFRFKPSMVPQGTIVPAAGYSGIIKPHFIPVASLYATHQISPRLTFGFGMFTPFGLASNFTNFNDSDPASSKFPGRFAGSRARMESYWFQPTIAYRISDNSAIAIGPALVHTHLEIERSFLNPQGDALTFGLQAAPTVFPGVNPQQAAAVIARLLPEGRSRVAGAATTKAIAGGYLYKNKRLKTTFGLSYRSPTTYHLHGAASFAFGPPTYALASYVGSSFLPNAFPNQNISGSFTLPGTYGAGISNTSIRNTTLAFDFRFQDYERFKSVPLDFPLNSGNNANVALPAEQRLVFNFRNGYDIAVGVERRLNDKTVLRLGYLYDRSPVPDASVGPLFPDANRNAVTVGGTRKAGSFDLTFFYEALFFEDRVVNVAANNNLYTNGDYNNFAHIFGLALRLNATEWAARKH